MGMPCMTHPMLCSATSKITAHTAWKGGGGGGGGGGSAKRGQTQLQAMNTKMNDFVDEEIRHLGQQLLNDAVADAGRIVEEHRRK